MINNDSSTTCLHDNDHVSHCIVQFEVNVMHFPVNSEANARRIAMVESCFGGAGQVNNGRLFKFRR